MILFGVGYNYSLLGLDERDLEIKVGRKHAEEKDSRYFFLNNRE